MGKRLEMNVDSFFLDEIEKMIREKEDIILLLLETMKRFLINEVLTDTENTEVKGKVILKKDKMSRLFYSIENKCFSFQFPFNLEIVSIDGKTNIKFLDPISGIELDNKLISILISLFRNGIMESISLEDLYYELNETEINTNVNDIWSVIKKLIMFEDSYLRFDYDPDNENGDLHPLNHFDLCYSSGGTFKIGVSETIDITEFIDILDSSTNCHYLTRKDRKKKR